MVCNTGVGLTPSVDGEVRKFTEQGLYNGLFLMHDEETGTYWNHMTGEAVHGPDVGKRLPVETVLHTTVGQILAQDPNTQVALSDHRAAVGRQSTLGSLLARYTRLPQMFPATLGGEDGRRPRMDLGIGIWDDASARYYAVETITAEGRALLDSVGGRTVLVYNDPTAYSPMAQYVDADRAWWEGDVLHMSNGSYIEGGVTHGADGSRVDVERPLQVFTRWYGFSQTFPETELYGEGR